MNIPRSLIRRIRREFRLALKPARRSAQLPVQLQVSGNQFTARAVSDSAAIEFSGEGEFGETNESAVVSLNDLKKFEGGGRESICIASNENEVVATWTDCGVPQVERLDRLEMPPFPTIAMTPVEVSAELIVALGNAAQCTAETSIRYALDVIKLDGEQGSVVGTDGRQLYKQTGFEFPWREGVLVPSNAWLQGAEFQSQSNIRVAKSDEWLMLQTGDWKLFLKIDSVRRFPDTSQVIPPESELATTLEINRADAQFLQIAIPRLPSANAPDHQVTLDLNGQISLRSRAADSDRATELGLNGSRYSGPPLAVNFNGNYLLQALRQGFDRVQLEPNRPVVVCHAPNRCYLWATIGGPTLPRSNKAIQIESNQTHPVSTEESETQPMKPTPTPSSTTITPPSITAMPPSVSVTRSSASIVSSDNPTETRTRKTHSNKRPSQTQPSVADTVPSTLLSDAEALYQSLRTAALQAKRIAINIRRQKKQSRLFESTLASLRQLEKVVA
jgi:hypothetical protein